MKTFGISRNCFDAHFIDFNVLFSNDEHVRDLTNSCAGSKSKFREEAGDL